MDILCYACSDACYKCLAKLMPQMGQIKNKCENFNSIIICDVVNFLHDFVVAIAVLLNSILVVQHKFSMWRERCLKIN